MGDKQQIIDGINARLRGQSFPAIIDEVCYICGRPAHSLIAKSENLLDRKFVCRKCGLAITSQQYRQGRHIVITAVSRDQLKSLSQNFKAEISRSDF